MAAGEVRGDTSSLALREGRKGMRGSAGGKAGGESGRACLLPVKIQ